MHRAQCAAVAHRQGGSRDGDARGEALLCEGRGGEEGGGELRVGELGELGGGSRELRVGRLDGGFVLDMHEMRV